VFALDKFEKSPLEYATENAHLKIAEQLEGKCFAKAKVHIYCNSCKIIKFIYTSSLDSLI
jgi:hypothetical protein